MIDVGRRSQGQLGVGAMAPRWAGPAAGANATRRPARRAIVALLAALYWLSVGHGLAWAQPQPRLSADAPPPFEPGVAVQLQFRAVNVGTDAFNGGSITVSFPGNPEVRVISSTIGNVRIYQPGESMFNFGQGRVAPITSRAVEAFIQPWPAGQAHALRVEVVSRAPFTVQARSTLSGERFVTDPDGGPLDQQGAPTLPIEVGSAAPVPKPQPKPEAKPEPKVEAKPEPKPEAKPEPPPESPTPTPLPPTATPVLPTATSVPPTPVPPTAAATLPTATAVAAGPAVTATPAAGDPRGISLPLLFGGLAAAAGALALGLLALGLLTRRRSGSAAAQTRVAPSPEWPPYPAGTYPPGAQRTDDNPELLASAHTAAVPAAAPDAPVADADVTVPPAPWPGLDRAESPSSAPSSMADVDDSLSATDTAEPYVGQVRRRDDTPTPRPAPIVAYVRPTGPLMAPGSADAAVLANKRYQQHTLVGRGGMGSVYRAYDTRLRRWVALKVMHRDLYDRPDFVERFLREAQAAAMLDHPNIVTIYDAEEVGDELLIVMAWIDGIDLQRLVEQDGPLPVERVARVLDQLAAALDHAHSRPEPVYHRDVKPSNMMVGLNDRVVLTDFGIARVIGASSLTGVGQFVGTPEYMAPEMVEGSSADACTDLYALGVVVYFMLTGRVPFQAETPLAVLHAQLNTSPPSPRTFTPDLPPDVDRVILTQLDKHPDRRYQSARELAAAFRDAIAASRT